MIGGFVLFNKHSKDIYFRVYWRLLIGAKMFVAVRNRYLCLLTKVNVYVTFLLKLKLQLFTTSN